MCLFDQVKRLRCCDKTYDLAALQVFIFTLLFSSCIVTNFIFK